MKIAKKGDEYIVITQNTPLYKWKDKRIHLIKLDFHPDPELLAKVFNTFPQTRRFIIEKGIKEYNALFKEYRNKKYYVENGENQDYLFSFLRKNNKIVFNFNKILNPRLKSTLLYVLFQDILRNVEVIQMCKNDFYKKKEELKGWGGNLILSDE